MSTRTGSAVVTLPTDTTILITRSFEAPVALVWETLTTPRHLLRWWGPTWCPLVSCEIDLRVGGSWRYLSRMDDGTELGWHGTYREIEPARRIVSTEVFEGFPDAESLNTMTLTHVDGVTTLETLVQHASQEFRDGHIASGMEAGMQETFDRLDDLLDRSGSTAERFRHVAGRFTDRAREVAPDAWDNPAPCDGWVARDVVRHMVEWMPGILSNAGVELAPIPSVDDDPVVAWTALADQLQGLLDDPVAAATEIDLGPAGHHTIESGIGMIMLGDVARPHVGPRSRHRSRRDARPGHRSRDAARHGADGRDVALERPLRPEDAGPRRRRRPDQTDRLHRPRPQLDQGHDLGTRLTARVASGSRHAKSRGVSWSAGMMPSRPAWKSSTAWRISSRVFMTNGP